MVIGWLLLTAPAAAESSARDAVARLTLVPVSPGGPPACPPVYPIDAVPTVDFEVMIDTDLGQLNIDDYLSIRAQLISAQFSVWLYRVDQPVPAGGRPGAQLVVEPDAHGAFPLQAASFNPGATYGWQAAALIHDAGGNAIRLWSPMLYFQTAPDETALPALLGDGTGGLAAELLQLCADQRRSQSALAIRLRGLSLYGNYPSASDTYFCTPLTNDEAQPYLAVDSGEEASLRLIIALGRIMAEVEALKHRDPATVTQAELSGIGARVYDLVNQDPELTVLPVGRRLSTVAAVAEKFNAPLPVDPQGVASLLNEMLLAIDGTVAGGTTDLNAGYGPLFITYAGRVAATIDRLVELKPLLDTAMGTEESAYWLEYFLDQQLQFVEMAEDVRQDRLSKALLADQLQEGGWSVIEAEDDAFRYLTGTTCRVDPDRIKRLTPADTAQVERLRAEVVRCHLIRLAGYLWPEID